MEEKKTDIRSTHTVIGTKEYNFNKKWFLVDIALISTGTIFLFYRIFFGIDFTDSSWYVAETYAVSEGAIPFVNNWTQAPGFPLPLAILMKIYTFFCGTEGIFLFSRIVYWIWLIFVGLIILYLIKHNQKYDVPMIALLPFLFITPHQIFYMNYNSIGLIYLLLVFMVLFVDFIEKEYVSGFLGGIIMARAVIATPSLLAPCIIIIMFLLCMKCRRKLIGFICGGIAATTLVVGWCCIVGGGIFTFIRGLFYWLRDLAYFKIEYRVTMYDNILELYHYFRIFIVCIFITLVAKYLLLKKEKYFEQFVYLLLGGCLIIGCMLSVYTGSLKQMAYWGWFEPIVLFAFLRHSEKYQYFRGLSILILLYAVTFVASSFSNIFGFADREYWLYIPIIVSFVTVFGWNVRSIFSTITVRLGIIMLTILMVCEAYSFVYRDASLDSLNTKISSGIWKGIYTTEERATGVVELENYIKSITGKEEKILFMDWASFGYLMSNGKVCASTTYDSMQYSYDVNNPEVMYDYFNLTNTVPDKIIYIDFGRDGKLSIEDEHWKFNQFVNENYHLENISEIKMFRVLCYELIDKEKALEMSRLMIDKEE